MKAMEDIESLDRKDSGNQLEWRLRCKPVPMIKKVGPKDIPPEMLAFIEESSFDTKTMKGEFTNNATREGVRKHLVNKGTMSFREIAGGKTERTIEGTLEIVGVTFLLRPLTAIAERIIYSEAQKLLDAEAKCVADFIKEHQKDHEKEQKNA